MLSQIGSRGLKWKKGIKSESRGGPKGCRANFRPCRYNGAIVQKEGIKLVRGEKRHPGGVLITGKGIGETGKAQCEPLGEVGYEKL